MTAKSVSIDKLVASRDSSAQITGAHRPAHEVKQDTRETVLPCSLSPQAFPGRSVVHTELQSHVCTLYWQL